MDLIDFFTRKWESKVNISFATSSGEYDKVDTEKYLLSLVAIPYQSFLDFVKEDPLSPFVLSSDVPQFSSIDAATNNICEILSNQEIRGYKFEEIGELLQPQRIADIVANKKYGENHVKTATDLGLCFAHNGRYFISPVGLMFSTLNKYQQDQLLARFSLRNNFVYTVIHKVLNGVNVDIADEISFLSESTVKRRKNNCLIMCSLVKRNRDINVEEIISKIK